MSWAVDMAYIRLITAIADGCPDRHLIWCEATNSWAMAGGRRPISLMSKQEMISSIQMDDAESVKKHVKQMIALIGACP